MGRWGEASFGANLRKGRQEASLGGGGGGGQRAPSPAERPLIGAAGRTGKVLPRRTAIRNPSEGGEPGGGKRGRIKIEPAD